jgi:hypothetical protein
VLHLGEQLELRRCAARQPVAFTRDQLARRSTVAAASRARHAAGMNTPQDLRWIIERLLELSSEVEARKENVSEADARAAVLARWSGGLELSPDIADIVSDLHAVPQEL